MKYTNNNTPYSPPENSGSSYLESTHNAYDQSFSQEDIDATRIYRKPLYSRQTSGGDEANFSQMNRYAQDNAARSGVNYGEGYASQSRYAPGYDQSSYFEQPQQYGTPQANPYQTAPCTYNQEQDKSWQDETVNFNPIMQQNQYDDGLTMAQRASGSKNPDLYPSYEQYDSSAYQDTYAEPEDGYDYDYPDPPKQKKGHGCLITLLVILLLLVGAAVVLWHMLFQAPELYTDSVHTRAEGVYNILLCATDEGGYRTDTIMLLTINGPDDAVSLTTLPRDTIVDNGEDVPKLNGVYSLGGCGESGAELLMSEIGDILGFEPDGYVIIDYSVFENVVDTLGGVTFDVPMDMTVGDITLYAGEQELNGEQALAVCRYREGYAMADIQRQYVQQSFLKALVNECLSPSNWSKLPDVYECLTDDMISDLSSANLRFIAMKVITSGADSIDSNTLPGEGVTYNGASCYGLYGQSVVDLINEVMNPFTEDITIDDVNTLTVSNGTLVKSTGTGVAFDPSEYSYD